MSDWQCDAATYQRNIPDCCALKTAKEHFEELGGCWGLLSRISGGVEMGEDACRGCFYYTDRRRGGEEER